MQNRSGVQDLPPRRQTMSKFLVRLFLPFNWFLPSKKQKEKRSSMKALQHKSGGLWRHSKQTSRILQKIELAHGRLSSSIMEDEKEIIRAIERNKISPELLILVEEAKALWIQADDVLGKRTETGDCHLHIEGLVDLYFELVQKLKVLEEDVKFSVELLHIRNIERSWQSPKITEKSSKNEKLQRMESEQYPAPDLSTAPSEEEVELKLSQSKEAKTDHDASSIGLSHFIQEEHESTPSPEIVSAFCPSTQTESEVITVEVEKIFPSEQVNRGSSSSQSKGEQHPNDDNQGPNPTDTPPAAYERLPPCIQEGQESTPSPELSLPVLEHEDEIVPTLCPSIQIESEVITVEVEKISLLEEVNGGSSSSQSKVEQHPNDDNQEPNPTDTPPAAYEIEGDISSEAERGKLSPIHSTSIKSSMLIPISVQGELSLFMEITLEILYGKRKWQNASNGFRNWNFVSGKENYYVLAKTISPDIPEHLIFKSEGDRMTNPPDEDKWKHAGVMVLTDDACPLLPANPDSPNLVLLFLQRNPRLRMVPESFFSTMCSLRAVDLSDNRIRSLPSSLFGLHRLEVLLLCNCSFIYSLPPEIQGLKCIEVLDLLGTELESVPAELGQLTNLKYLQISFYGTDDEREHDHLPPILLSLETVSKLQRLEALSIVVHPEDLRWVRNAEKIIENVGNLEHLSYLHFYFPKAEIMEQFIKISPSWEKISCNKFKFVVGQNVKRIVDRISGDVEHKFNEQDRCLRFVNGNKVPRAVEKVLKHATAFYLDHHSVICSLSEFGITKCNQLTFCVVRECPSVEVIISEEIDEPAFPCLEYLGLHYLWKFDSICKNELSEGSFVALKSLTVDTCPKLEYIFSESLLQCFCNLEELVVEDCESLKEIIEKSDKKGNADFSTLPRLREVKLYYLPQLLRLWWEGYPLQSRGFQLECLTLQSCPMLDRSILTSVVKVLKEVEPTLTSVVKELKEVEPTWKVLKEVEPRRQRIHSNREASNLNA